MGVHVCVYVGVCMCMRVCVYVFFSEARVLVKLVSSNLWKSTCYKVELSGQAGEI